ncbi:MAG TPA: Nif3-like dinuclear metal center hexameric protein [Gammaproteobacteria bacterium]|nr:Nif3-like dinuclear metal center hexameric protein [Gammaproteobacteria bacterium]
MVRLTELVDYLGGLLQVEAYSDYAPNGLQVAGCDEVRRIVSGVTASRALVDAAVTAGADALIVHHGFFWRGEDPCINKIKKNRLLPLLRHDISLLAYHLPLDDHETLGNNVQLARVLGIARPQRLAPAPPWVWRGELPGPQAPQDFATRIDRALGRNPLWISGGAHPIRRVAWCTGGAQKYIEHAAAQGLDAYISGEISEATVHSAREWGIHYFAAGHHATERYGVAALGGHIAEKYAVEHRFIDIGNPA